MEFRYSKDFETLFSIFAELLHSVKHLRFQKEFKNLANIKVFEKGVMGFSGELPQVFNSQ